MGAQHHDPVVPVDQFGQHLLLARREPTTAPLVGESVEQDAVFDGRAAVADAPQALVVEGSERNESRCQIVGQGLGGAQSRAQGQKGFVLDTAVVAAGAPLQLVVQGAGRVSVNVGSATVLPFHWPDLRS